LDKLAVYVPWVVAKAFSPRRLREHRERESGFKTALIAHRSPGSMRRLNPARGVGAPIFVAAPIFNDVGVVIASISVRGFTWEIPTPRVAEIGRLVIATAREISQGILDCSPTDC
jgi:hypothetical protein